MKNFFLGFVVATTILSFPVAGFAAACTPDPATGLQCPLDESLFSDPSFITNLINKVANWLFTFLLILAVLFIVLAGYKYMFSQGSEESVASAHKMLIYAAVAIAVALLSRGLVGVVRGLVGGSVGTPAGTPVSPTGATPPAAPAPVPLEIRDDTGTKVSTPAVLPSSEISIFSCTLANGSKWIPAFEFVGIPNVTTMQGGCSGLCMTHEKKYGAYQLYTTTGGVKINMETCQDGTSPKFFYNGESFGGN